MCRRHGLARLVTRRSEVHKLPPPPLKRWSVRLVQGHRHLTSGFASSRRSEIRVYRGFFSGPTQACPMQARAGGVAHAAADQRVRVPGRSTPTLPWACTGHAPGSCPTQLHRAQGAGARDFRVAAGVDVKAETFLVDPCLRPSTTGATVLDPQSATRPPGRRRSTRTWLCAAGRELGPAHPNHSASHPRQYADGASSSSRQRHLNVEGEFTYVDTRGYRRLLAIHL